jgi:protoheme IX farnesyltransferase
VNTNVLALTRSGASKLARVHDFAELTKLRISVLVAMTVATAICVAMDVPDGWLILNASLATALVAASASVFNQIIERNSDRLMDRTANRSLPAGRVSTGEAMTFGLGLLAVGALYLWLSANWQAAALGLLTWLLYVGVYTPLKRFTVWNTFIGAVPGAMPVLMGWAATGESFDLRAWSLFALLFFWQFPHFMAIAWRCREQYQTANLWMVTVADPTGRSAGWYAVLAGAIVIPISGVLALSMGAHLPITLVIAGVGIWQLVWAVRFCTDRNDEVARGLLRASLVYLPIVLIGVVCASFI